MPSHYRTLVTFSIALILYNFPMRPPRSLLVPTLVSSLLPGSRRPLPYVSPGSFFAACVALCFGSLRSRETTNKLLVSTCLFVFVSVLVLFSCLGPFATANGGVLLLPAFLLFLDGSAVAVCSAPLLCKVRRAARPVCVGRPS